LRWTAGEPQEGHTKGLWSRSAAIKISASGARYSLMPRRPTVGPSGGNGGASCDRDPTFSSIYGRPEMRAKQRTWLLLAACITLPGARSAAAQAVHIVRLEVDVAREVYRFVPARVTARPGDILRFRVSSGSPHNITFAGEGLPAGAREALDAAMPGRTGELSSPVLDRPGAEYRIVVPALAPGRYPFFCTPHRVYDMRGELIVPK
jgi:plastocyanin